VHGLEVVCSEGVITWNYLTGQIAVWSHDADAPVLHASAGISGRDALFVEEARHFLDVVAGDATPLCTLADGVAVARICDAIERAARTGDAVYPAAI
jgi:predicted dehydrogenase